MVLLVKAIWNTHGFEQKDIPEKEWDSITDEFMKLRDQFIALTNGSEGYSQLNKDFEALYPNIDYVGNEDVDGYIYGSFLAWRLNDMLRAKMKKDASFMHSEMLEPYVFMDGSSPDIGFRLKKYGTNCTIDLSLERVEG